MTSFMFHDSRFSLELLLGLYDSRAAKRHTRCWRGNRDSAWRRVAVDFVDCRRDSANLERVLLALAASAVRSDR